MEGKSRFASGLKKLAIVAGISAVSIFGWEKYQGNKEFTRQCQENSYRVVPIVTGKDFWGREITAPIKVPNYPEAIRNQKKYVQEIEGYWNQ